MRFFTTILIASLAAFGGCAQPRASQLAKYDWQPTPEEVAGARKLAETFVTEHLDVARDELQMRKVSAFGMVRDGDRLIVLEFFDPQHFPDWEEIAGVLGGFPWYFSVTVDLSRGEVVHHYASTQ